jgi:hypothetical protein
VLATSLSVDVTEGLPGHVSAALGDAGEPDHDSWKLITVAGTGWVLSVIEM